MTTRLTAAFAVTVAVLIAGCSTTPSATSTASVSPETRINTTPATALSCPARPPVIPMKAVAPSGHLAPTDATQAIACQYAGSNESSEVGTLTSTITIRDPSGLAVLLNQAKRVPSTAIYDCTIDLGGMTVIVFADPAGTTTVEVPTTGCRFASSTSVSGAWSLSPAAFRALRRLDPIVK